MARKEALVFEDFHIGTEKFRDHVLEQFNEKLLEGGFFLAKLLDAMLPEVPAANVKKK